MAEHREVERTYAPQPGIDLPDLASLPGVAEVGSPSTDQLMAVYFDTADLALARAGVSLRRRTGGPDAGWHLKVPAGAGRDEVRVPLSRALHHPPAVLRRYVVAWVRDAPLAPIATIATTRTTRQLLGVDGSSLAELAEDEVTGTPTSGAGRVAWREWELELTSAQTSLLDAADQLMAGIGVAPSTVQRKLLHVLGDRVPATPALPEVGRDLPAGRVLHRRLLEQVDELKRRDSQIRRGRDEGIHQARVACRRLRAALATYRSLLDPDATGPIRDEIRWLGRSLSDARDATVVRERLQGMVDVEPPDVVTASAQTRLDTTFAEQRRAAWAVVDATLSSDRYLSLLDALDRLVTAPPFAHVAEHPAGEVLPPLVRKEWRRLRQRVAAVATAAEHDAAWHDVRKRGKRLRYSAEALEPVFGTDAKLLANAAKDLSSHLGERQDTVMSRPVLLDIAAGADAAGESTVIWGVLVARDEERRAELDQEFPALWETVSRKQLRRWLG